MWSEVRDEEAYLWGLQPLLGNRTRIVQAVQEARKGRSENDGPRGCARGNAQVPWMKKRTGTQNDGMSRQLNLAPVNLELITRYSKTWGHLLMTRELYWDVLIG